MNREEKRSIWLCSQCAGKQKKWSGQCTHCQAWDTLREEIDHLPPFHLIQKGFPSSIEKKKPISLKAISLDRSERILTHSHEFDRLLGGGIVPGSFILIGGEPGVGKSTLLLQISQRLAKQRQPVLYVCGEESLEQTKRRASRLEIEEEGLFLLNETNLSSIVESIFALQVNIVILDSIQILYRQELSSPPGSITQVRECARECMEIAKQKKIAILLIGHITKSGEIAGPKILEHLVDTVLYFEGEKMQQQRILRTVKNRFGPTDEIALFSMHARGLREIQNPSQIFLEQRASNLAGSVIVPLMEGSRPLLVEIQALVTKTAFSTPSRRATGFDLNRLSLLLAVMEKRMKFHMHQWDIFVSIAGGLKISEPAADLAVLLAIFSSWTNCPLLSEVIVMGEVGLGGEVRAIARIESRLREAEQMGFSKMYFPQKNTPTQLSLKEQTQLFPIATVEEIVSSLNRSSS